ncbi:MAG: GIY-YIG nuclease family protein [Salinibacterium sp.]|nr:GIY-YIG nuclease family protein [Salinibacterium sp.]
MGCGIVERDGSPCSGVIDSGTPLNLCASHLAIAHDWVEREVGATGLLPAPCLACGSRIGLRFPAGWLCADCEWRVGEIPDPDVALPRVDVVYYLRFRDRVKIGTSANPRTRIAALPHEEVLAFERGDRRVEQRRHAEFAEHRIPRSEWFYVHDALAAHIAELRAGVDDPWGQYETWLSREIGRRG